MIILAIFLLIEYAITAESTNASVMPDSKSLKPIHHRQKRGDCSLTAWNIEPSCFCGDHCWDDSYKISFQNDCGNNDFPTSAECCVVKTDNKFQLSSDCPACGTYLDLNCFELEQCWDSQKAYQCSCSQGYLSPNNNEICPLHLIYSGIACGVFIYAVCASFLIIRRWLIPHLEDAKLKKKISTGVIPIQCNVLTIVDDVDEFKVHTTRLQAALFEIYPSIAFERLSTYDVLNTNYELKCDKLLVFLETNSTTVKNRKVAAISKKVQFQSIAVVCLGDGIQTQPKELDDSLCLVPSLINLEGWLPVVLTTLFQVRRKFLCFKKTVFLYENSMTSNNDEYCKGLRSTVESILVSFGAALTPSPESANYEIGILNSVPEILNTGDVAERRRKSFYIFVSSGIGIERLRQHSRMNVFGRKDAILGITRLLFKMNLIQYNGKSVTERRQYFQLKRQLVMYKKNGIVTITIPECM